MSCLPHANSPDPHKRRLPQKAPYDYYYEFPAEGDDYPRKMSIEDRKAGFLYWNCLRRTKGDETQADQQARKKYALDFLAKKAPYLLVGTIKKTIELRKTPLCSSAYFLLQGLPGINFVEYFLLNRTLRPVRPLLPRFGRAGHGSSPDVIDGGRPACMGYDAEFRNTSPPGRSPGSLSWTERT